MSKTDSNKSNIGKAFAKAFPHTIPVLTGFTVLGIAYGMLMAETGYNPLWIAAFSAFCFCGSMQFATIPFLIGEFRPLYVLVLSVMVNARHLFYGLSMLEKYKGTGKFKAFIIYWMCDETFAINSITEVPENIDKGQFYFAVSILDWLYWINGGIIGGIVGSLITINTAGLDFALTALFVVLFIEQLKNKRNAICGIIGIIAALVSLLLFGADNMVIVAMVIILIALIAGRSKLCE